MTAPAMDAFDRFATAYLAQWEQRATVRGKKRYALSGSPTDDDLFPAALQPLCQHPAVGPEARRFILAQTLYWMQEEIALLEVDVVSRLASDVANRPHRVALPASVRQVALTVAVDEVYHAFAAREFAEQVEHATGIRPMDPPRKCGLDRALAAALAVTPRAMHDDVGLAVLCIAENSITSEIFGMVEGSEPGTAFHIVSEEHLVDERRHSAYFQHLLRHYWEGLGSEARDMLGRAVPAFLDEYLKPPGGEGGAGAMLRAAGLTGEQADAALGGLLARPFALADHPLVRNIVRVLERSGLLAHEPIREALTQRGWIGSPPAA
jgi:hypothetical protein